MGKAHLRERGVSEMTTTSRLPTWTFLQVCSWELESRHHVFPSCWWESQGSFLNSFDWIEPLETSGDNRYQALAWVVALQSIRYKLYCNQFRCWDCGKETDRHTFFCVACDLQDAQERTECLRSHHSQSAERMFISGLPSSLIFISLLHYINRFKEYFCSCISNAFQVQLLLNIYKNTSILFFCTAIRHFFLSI